MELYIGSNLEPFNYLYVSSHLRMVSTKKQILNTNIL